ncbi:uncharacterized protein LOC126829817 isoform X2 [Patella vulgata]|uniref:uncharacterized protein LOC126829817 isoform X2 n=1 Tax=Patella vulgata TaxID=6465 RepID=UPI00217F3A17|nr:uncharacterized protein LOC126829817 isoform X2 [Patella vulgata]
MSERDGSGIIDAEIHDRDQQETPADPVEYTLFTDKVQFWKARMICRLNGGTLATITDKDTLDTVNSFIANEWKLKFTDSNRDAWIGLYWYSEDILLWDDYFCPNASEIATELLTTASHATTYTAERLCFQIEGGLLILDVCQNVEYFICQQVMGTCTEEPCATAKLVSQYKEGNPGECPERATWMPTITHYETMTIYSSVIQLVNQTVTATQTETTSVVVTQSLTVTFTETHIQTMYTTVITNQPTVVVNTIFQTVTPLPTAVVTTVPATVIISVTETVISVQPSTVYKTVFQIPLAGSSNLCGNSPETPSLAPPIMSSFNDNSSLYEEDSSKTWLCRYVPVVDYHTSSVNLIVSSLVGELTVQKGVLSKTVYKKNCIADHRPTAITIGCFGIIMVSTVIAVIIFFDVQKMVVHAIHLCKS